MRPHNGNTMATQWQHNGNTMATQWQHNGNTMATQWQHNGNTTTIRSGQQTKKQRMSTDSKVLYMLKDVPKALDGAVNESTPQHVHVGDHHCVVRDVTAIAVVQHGNAWHGGNVVLQRTKKRSSGNRC
jgi:hypothetical protein